MIEDDRPLRKALLGWPGASTGQAMPSDMLATALEQYSLYVQLTDRISERRQSANSFFVALNTAVVALLGYSGPNRGPLPEQRLYFAVTVAGLILCLLWYRIVRSYRDLNTAKFAVVHEMEQSLPYRPYTAEWEFVGRGQVSKLYKPLTHLEVGVPWLFFALYAAGFVALLLKGS